MERGWMDGQMAETMIRYPHQKGERSWEKQNRDQIEEIFWFCRKI